MHHAPAAGGHRAETRRRCGSARLLLRDRGSLTKLIGTRGAPGRVSQTRWDDGPTERRGPGAIERTESAHSIASRNRAWTQPRLDARQTRANTSHALSSYTRTTYDPRARTRAGASRPLTSSDASPSHFTRRGWRRLREESFARRPSRCDGAVGEMVDEGDVRSVRARAPLPPFAPTRRDRLRSRGGGGGVGVPRRLTSGRELRDDSAPQSPFRSREGVGAVARARRRFHRR